MALDPRKRQKKVERRNAKQKQRKHAHHKQVATELAVRFERASHYPILHCCTSNVLEEQGMSNVLWSRVLPSGNVAYAGFLVDKYCLGVKDATVGVESRGRYDWHVYERLFRDQTVISLQPEYARKLIEGAVEYARGLGFEPSRDYRIAQRIFGGVDAAASDETITYGKDGKPFFIAGPNDSPARCRAIIGRLTSRLGHDGFHYLVPVTAEEASALFLDPEQA